MRAVVVTMALVFVGPRAATAGQADPPVAVVGPGEGIRLDGVLDEAAWRRATPIGPLLQRDPKEGAPASEETEVKVLFDADNLYVGVNCRDRTPSAIVSTQLGRDADLEVDDRITIVLDPFFDHKNGFFFVVNPAGARSDGQISNNAQTLTYEWDAIWDARARITESGWVAEIAIPFKSLRFKPGQTVWGFNVERQIKRLQEHDRWASPRLDTWISNLAAAGQLTQLAGLQQGRGLDIRPFVSGGEESAHGKFKAGVDVFKSVTAGITASLTVNTDFAETEVDARQINLTRFELFFPEKRTFFLEGAGIYDVAGLGSQNQTQDLIPFFSRTIGLLNGQEVPILFGLKVSGRQAGLNVGLLDVETRDTTLVGGPLPAQNLLAVRVSKNLFEQSFIGAIATHGNPTGAGDNTLVGVDARFATSHFRGGKSLALSLYGLRTDDAASGTVDYAAGFELDYPNDLWNVMLTGKRIGENFRPAMGFVPRTGIQSTDLYVAFQPRPERFGIRQFFFEVEPSLITNLHGVVENWRVFTAPFNVRTESGEHLEWNYIPTFERLDAPFEVQPSIVIPPGSYRTTRYRTEVNTATKRPWVVDFAFRWGGFYQGTLRQYQPVLTLKPSMHLAIVLKMERDEGSLPQGDFVTQIYSGRLDYNFSPNLTWSNLAQYDSPSRILGF
ncbi:MAG TPA: DUF5916 domain-containing protein, partial [Candidatus Eisenbacteria bacterium]|nr:DUF5916 domain-containing protein [Candidatus Eisenbacteria bacterium]